MTEKTESDLTTPDAYSTSDDAPAQKEVTTETEKEVTTKTSPDYRPAPPAEPPVDEPADTGEEDEGDDAEKQDQQTG